MRDIENLTVALKDQAVTEAFMPVVAPGSIEVLNHALAGLPEDRIRYHLCWGSWHGPHAHDVPLRDIIDIVLRVRAGT